MEKGKKDMSTTAHQGNNKNLYDTGKICVARASQYPDI